jgi:hypothetical protein
MYRGMHPVSEKRKRKHLQRLCNIVVIQQMEKYGEPIDLDDLLKHVPLEHLETFAAMIENKEDYV